MSLRQLIVMSSAVLLTCAAVAPAQRLIGPNPRRDPTTQGVYVRDSAVAGEKLALAQRMEHLKEWDKSADVYQEIVEKYSDRVVPVSDETGGQRYTSVTLRVQELLGKWPDEGLQRYRARFEPTAAGLLESAGGDDTAGLLRVVQLYFATDASKSAGMRLIELYVENGEFAAAAWLGERLLAYHPGVAADDRPRLLFRTALAEHLGGDDASARRNLDQLKSQHPNAVGKVRGQDVPLAAELEKMLASPPAVARGASPDSWPLLGGDASRGRVPQVYARPSARLPADIALSRTRTRPLDNPARIGQNLALERQKRDNGLELTVIPAVDRGEIFYQFNGRVYARGLESGLPLPGWATTYSDDATGRPRFAPGVASIPAIRSELTVTVTDSAVLAVLGQQDPVFFNSGDMPVVTASVADTRLVCLDRASGVQRWSASPRLFPAAQAALNTLELGGSPLVVGDNVYVAARGGKRGQFEDSYVVCFSLADGKFRWACYLASGNAPGAFGPVAPSVLSHLAYAGGRVYAVTNLGAVAAVDAYAGTIVWLTLYPRPATNVNVNGMFMAMQGGQMLNNMRKPWAQNPVIVKEGRVFCLPADAQHALIYDAGSGAEIKRIPVTEVDNADTLLGVIGDKLILSGKKNVFCVNWPKYDSAARGAAADAGVFWVAPMGGNGTDADNVDTIRGRGFVTSDSVFIPTKWNLRRLDINRGRVEDTYPRGGDAWGSGEGPGNVLATSDQVIVAGADSINVYSDLAMARAKLDREVAASASDPMPRLKYAEMLFAAGEFDAAVQKLDEAIALLGGLKAMRSGPARDRAFARALTFAERSAEPKVGAGDATRAASLYDRAASAADSPQQQVAWRLSRARFARNNLRDFVGEVALYQQILSDPAYRAALVPASDEAGGATPAGAIAEARIATCIKENPSVYAQFEQAARDALSSAQKNKDPAAMLAVAQVYPNARCAIPAMLAAAESFESAGNFRQATQVLGQAYRKCRDNPTDRARIVEAQARNYLHLPGGVGVAIGRLSEGAKADSGAQLQRPLTRPDGESIDKVTFGAAASWLEHYSARTAQATLPEFNIPPGTLKPRIKPLINDPPDSLVSDVDLLVLPPSELRDRARYDRVVTWTKERGISAYAIGSNAPTGAAAGDGNSLAQQPPRGGVWVGNDLLVWTADAITLLKGDALTPAWSAPVRNLPSAEIVQGDPSVVRAVEDPQAQAGGIRGDVIIQGDVVIMDNQVVRIGGGGRVVVNNGVIIQGPNGAIAVQEQRKGGEEQITHVRPVGDRVVIGTSSGRLAAIDLSNGQVAWQTRVGAATFEQVLASDDFVAVRFNDDVGSQIVAVDTFAGQIVMRFAFAGGPAGNLPLNMALSPDGTLVYSLPDRVCGKDLYEPGKTLKFGDSPLQPDGSRVLENATGPDQLLISEGRILALSDQGQTVRVLSSEDGKEIPRQLSSNAGQPPNNWKVWMRVVGPRVYVFSRRSVRNYNLDHPEQNGSMDADPRGTPAVRDAFIGKRQVVLLDFPPAQAGGEPPAVAVRCYLWGYARYPAGATEESGRLDLAELIEHAAGIDQWQPVEGGFYYRSVDRKAHFLKGTTPPAPADAPAPPPAPAGKPAGEQL
jgi:outer membrane protein assembly factor BamB